MLKHLSFLILLFVLTSCFRTIQVPADPMVCPATIALKQPKLLDYPDEPTRRLNELTAGTSGVTKLTITLEANKRTIISLENAIKASGRFKPRPQ